MQIRAATCTDAEAITKVHIDTWRSAYRTILPAELLADLSTERRVQQWKDILCNPESTGFTYVVEEEFGQVVGFASGGPERSGDPVYKGEVYALYVLEAYQRHGLGRRLVGAVARQLAQRAMPSLLLGVLAENPARHFYEALGGQYVRTVQIELGGRQFEEVFYGWRDSSELQRL